MPGKKLNRIKAALAEAGRTNLWLASQLDVNKATVSKWCTNEMQPRIEMLSRIAEQLDVDIRELLLPTK